MHIEAKTRVENLNSLEDVATAGRISRIMLEHITINITHMTSNRNSMAHHVVCVEDLTILLSTEHDINNIMEKMSINPHQSQQSNLYQ